MGQLLILNLTWHICVTIIVVHYIYNLVKNGKDK
jgi:hypothetical protein